MTYRLGFFCLVGVGVSRVKSGWNVTVRDPAVQAATRSRLNTAKLMEHNPTLLRLKELEVLEKATEKVDRLSVFGGLDGVLKDTVKINV